MKQPDRWERMVLKKANPDFLIGTNEAIYLLRKEHAWVRRMVRKVYNWQAEQLADDEDAVYEILKQLKEREK